MKHLLQKYKIHWDKKKIKPSIILLSVFLLGFIAKCALPTKIATVDIQTIIRNSPEVLKLRQEHTQQLMELEKWINEAEQEIKSEKKKAKRSEMAREYKEIGQRRSAELKQSYQERLTQVDKDISALIHKTARSHGCRFVFDQKAVVDGGVDITQEVVTQLKKAASEKK